MAATLQSPAAWTQFRLNPGANAVLPGTLSVRWQRHFGGAYSSSPTIVNGVLYAANNNGLLVALDPSTGRTLWTYRAYNALMAEPLVYRGLVIAGEGDEMTREGTPEHPVRIGARASAIVALDARTGKRVWRRMLAGTAMPTPAIIANTIVHLDGAGFVVSLDVNDGRPEYQIPIASMASMSAIVPVARNAYATTGSLTNAVWRLRADSPAVQWQYTFSNRDGGVGDCPPAVMDGLLFCNYVTSPKRAVLRTAGDWTTMHAYAIDVTSGKRIWDITLEGGRLPKRNEAAIPLAVGDTVYEGSALAPYMHAIQARTGRIRWRFRTRGAVKGGAVFRAGTLYFADTAGYVYALDARTGTLRGSTHVSARFNVGSPVLAGRTLIIGSAEGALLAIPLRDLR